jgi:FolB domain-containing protein
MGWIRVKGLRVETVIGTEPHERLGHQEIWVDYGFRADLSQAGQSDRLEDTIDYMSFNRQIVRLIESARDLLLERLATRILDQMLTEPRVLEAFVEVYKPRALPGTDTVSVRLERRRDRITGETDG